MIPQALHIFRKDFRYLRVPLVVFLLLVVAFSLTQISQLASPVLLLMAASAGLLIARLVHAEAIAGTSQFWITRPYNWKSLLLAKLLYVLLCVDVPIGLARLVGLIRWGYPVATSLLPLLWAQILLFAVLAVMVALTSLTSGIVELILTLLGATLVLAVVLLGGRTIAVNKIPQYVVWPDSVDWIPLSISGLLSIVITVLTLRWQYRDRRTRFSRNFVIAGAIATELVAFAIPVTAGLRFQGLFSTEPAPALQVTLGVSAARDVASPGEVRSHVYRMPIVIHVSGVPKDNELRPDLADMRITWAGGEIARGRTDLFGGTEQNGRITLNGRFAMPQETFDRFRMTRATLHVSMYLTLFGEPESTTVPFDSVHRNVGNGTQCYTNFRGQVIENEFDVYNCMAFFGWPSRLVSVSTREDREDFTKIVSYAPFPSGPALDSNAWNYVTLPWSKQEGPPKQVTVTMKRPLVHFHQDFTAENIRLGDLVSK